jgi:nitrite reductase (NADH) large subunit
MAADESDDEITLRDDHRGHVQRRSCCATGKMVGAVLYGDVADGGWYLQLIRDKVDVSALRDRLVFGRAFAEVDSVPSAASDVAAMPDDAQICGCNGVSKSTIVCAIRKKELTSLSQVRATPRRPPPAVNAHRSSKHCSRKRQASRRRRKHPRSVTARSPVTTKYAEPSSRARSSRCRGTRRLRLEEARGCHKCRPALNYYLLCAWPGEYRDDSRSRFVNERRPRQHPEGRTYSVVPRMWGGVTTPPSCTPSHRSREILPSHRENHRRTAHRSLGVKKEDLPAVWGDLNKAGLVSGHAYAKGLRTVKTCVGSEWCRFGVQESTGSGSSLEKMCWGSWTPHKVKFAVSGCPRNCAEATIKDMGVVCVEAGYDIMVGGNGGIEVRVTDHLVRVATEAEVLEYAGRLHAALPRRRRTISNAPAPWIARVGLAYVKKRLVEDAGRPARPQRAVPLLADIRAERSLGRARARHRCARIRPPAGTGADRWSTLSWSNIGSLENVPVRGARRLCMRHLGRPIAVFRTGENSVFALRR